MIHLSITNFLKNSCLLYGTGVRIMKRVHLGIILSAAVVLTACSSTQDKVTKTSVSKVTSTESIPQETSSSKAETASEKYTSTTTVHSEISETIQTETVSLTNEDLDNQTPPSAVQEESYEELKQRTLISTPADRTNWSNKEWEAFGMALFENGLALDDQGNIISEADQQYTQEEQTEEPTTLTDFVNTYGMSPAAYKIQYEGMSEEEALRSTPKEMKSSGEIQLGFLKYGIE